MDMANKKQPELSPVERAILEARQNYVEEEIVPDVLPEEIARILPKKKDNTRYTIIFVSDEGLLEFETLPYDDMEDKLPAGSRRALFQDFALRSKPGDMVEIRGQLIVRKADV